MGWAASHHAPRDREVWLYLPSSSYKTDERGRPYDVKHETVIAAWDKTQGVWCTKEGRHVFPSLWHDVPVGGAAPEQPDLN